MFYRLKDNFVLRGYEKLPYAIIDTKTGKALFLNAETMGAVELCNGNCDLSLPLVPDKVREINKEINEDGIRAEGRKNKGYYQSNLNP